MRIWIVNAQEVYSQTVRSCIRCFKCKPRLLNEIMGNLTANRLRVLRPFDIRGVEFCGPVYTTLKIRGRPPYKSYIALFVCFASKTVNLSPGISADRALRQRDEFRRAESPFRRSATDDRRASGFVLTPPRAPHMRELCEAYVKIAKHLLLRAVGNAQLRAGNCKQSSSASRRCWTRGTRTNQPGPQRRRGTDTRASGDSVSLLAPPALRVPDQTGLNCLRQWRLVSSVRQLFWQQWSWAFKSVVSGSSSRPTSMRALSSSSQKTICLRNSGSSAGSWQLTQGRTSWLGSSTLRPATGVV